METYEDNDIEAGLLLDDTWKRHLELYKTALNGDWEIAESIYKDHPEDVTARITARGETALHVAAAAERSHFMEKLVKMMSEEDLASKDTGQGTALYYAVVSGKVELAKLLVNKNKGLPMIRVREDRLPIRWAALYGQRKMVSYLFEVSNKDQLTRELVDQLQRSGDKDSCQQHHRIVSDLEDLLGYLIEADIYDIALKILKPCGDVAFSGDSIAKAALLKLAGKSHMPPRTSQKRLGIWNRCINSFSDLTDVQKTKDLHDQALELVNYIWEKVLTLSRDHSHIYEIVGVPNVIFTAAQHGNVNFLKLLIGSYPRLVFYKQGTTNHSLFHTAVLHRQENVFKLIHKIGSYKNRISRYEDEDGNNMLHLAGKFLPAKRLNEIPGAALQLQFELMWFEEVKKVVEPQLIEAENDQKKTPTDVFVEEHKELRKEGEKWMKDTANSCMLVATLIATVAFAAAFTVPGGNRDDGIPNFVKETAFRTFAIADAISMVSSASSILTFLSILTARYTEYDFLWSLPNRLMIGLGTLFVSIVGMMVAFIAAFFILLKDGLVGIAIPVAAISIFPVMLFIFLHFRLLNDVVNSIYKSRSLFKPSKEPLFVMKLRRGEATKRLSKTTKTV